MKVIWSTLSLLCLLLLATACTASTTAPVSPSATPTAAVMPTVRTVATPVVAATQLPATSPAPLALGQQQSGDLIGWLSSTPTLPIIGYAQLDLFLTTSSGEPVKGAKVTFDTDMTNMSHGPNLVSANPAGEGHYGGRVRFMMAGPWRVIAVVERPGEPTVRLRFNFRVNTR